MDYQSFAAGFVAALFIMACIWLYRTLQTDPVPEIPDLPQPKRRGRKPKVQANAEA